MVTDDIQELLEGTMGDDRMAELLHTLSVSPEKRRAFREYLTLNKEMKDDRYASVLTLGEDAAVWESLAAAGAVGSTAAATAGRSVGIWFGRAAALLAVGIVGYILGSSSTTTTTTGSGNHVANTLSHPTARIAQHGTTVPASSDLHTLPTQQTAKQITAPSAATRVGSGSGPNKPAPARGTMASADAGNLEGARQMFDLLGGAPFSASNELPFAASIPAIDSTPTAHGTASQDRRTTQPAALPPAIDTALHPGTEAALRQMPNTIPIEGEDSSPLSTFFHNGFETAFSERLGLLTPAPPGVQNPDREFSYRALDLSYRMNSGQLGFGLRFGYGTFSRVSLEAVPVTRANDNGISDETVKYTSTLTASKRVTAEAFVNYRHSLSDRFALGLEASFGGSSSHQQGGVDLTMIGFITDRIGLQIGGGAGTYWYNLTAERNQVLSEHPNAAIDNDSKQAYRGIMLLARYGLFYRF